MSPMLSATTHGEVAHEARILVVFAVAAAGWLHGFDWVGSNAQYDVAAYRA